MSKDLEQILKLIEELRQKLHNSAFSRNLTDQEVIKASENINNALNEYYSLLQKKKEKDS